MTAAPDVLNPDVAIGSFAEQVTETSLTLPADLASRDWFDMGERFSAMQRGALLWWIGDWIDFGLEHYDINTETAAQLTDFDERTLQQILQVARAFSPERRRKNLAFSKHAVVVALDPETADHWLDEAEENLWTRDELRAAVRPPKERAALEVGTPLEVVRAVAKRIGRNFDSCVVEDDGKLLLDDGDGHRWRVSVEPA